MNPRTAYANTRDIGYLTVLMILLLDHQFLTQIELILRHVIPEGELVVCLCQAFRPLPAHRKLCLAPSAASSRVLSTLIVCAARASIIHRHLEPRPLRQ